MDVTEVVSVKDLWVEYCTPEGVVHAVNGVSFTIPERGMLGLMGESGSGKSTIIMSMLGLLRPPHRVSKGEVYFEGENLRAKTELELRNILGAKISLITQNPRSALNPLETVGNQIANVIQTHKTISRKEAYQKAMELIESVGIADPMRRAAAYPHELSGGMAQRISIAIALSCSPRLLIADDPTTNLDATIQAQVLDKIQELISERNNATLIVTRDLGIIAQYCLQVAVIYAGQIVESADVTTFFDNPQHPYSLAAMSCISSIVHREHEGKSLSGSPPNPRNLPKGCLFHPRCRICSRLCEELEPQLEEIEPGHLVRCHLTPKRDICNANHTRSEELGQAFPNKRLEECRLCG